MQQELQLLQQQLDIEEDVCSTTVGFLNTKSSSLQDAAVSWHSKREDDALSKERELEVSCAGVSQERGVCSLAVRVCHGTRDQTRSRSCFRYSNRQCAGREVGALRKCQQLLCRRGLSNTAGTASCPQQVAGGAG